MRYKLKLFSNFTFALDRPVDGDQFSQTDERDVYGLRASHAFGHTLGGLPARSEFGLQLRHDRIRVGLFDTVARSITNTTRDDDVRETLAGRVRPERRGVLAHRPRRVRPARRPDPRVGQQPHARRQLGQRKRHADVAQAEPGVRPVREHRVLRQRGQRLSQQRRARHHRHHRPEDRRAGRQGAAAGARQGLRARRTHRSRRRTAEFARVVVAELRFRTGLRRRRRHHRGQRRQPPPRHRVQQPVGAGALVPARCRLRVDARTL